MSAPPAAASAPSAVAPAPPPVAGRSDGGADSGPDGGAARTRPGRRRWLVAALVVLLVAVPLVGALLGARASGRDLDPQNPAPAGARALAQLLEQGGVPVQRVTRVDAAAAALAGSGGAATLVVTDPVLVDPQRLARAASAAAAVVLLEPDAAALAVVAPSLTVGPEGQDGEQLTTAVRPASSQGQDPGLASAGCDDPDARAAGEASTGGEPLRADGDGARVCFDGAYGTAESPDGVTVRVFGLGAAVSNDLLDDAGNAALALRAAGSEPRVVWLVSSALDADPQAAPSALELLPGWVAPVAAQLALVALAAVAWRARRFGALVVEPLPVVVRSVETARGRAALYRAARDRGAAARALRAAARWRLAARLGLPPSTAPAVVAEAAAHAAGGGRAPATALLAGPPRLTTPRSLRSCATSTPWRPPSPAGPPAPRRPPTTPTRRRPRERPARPPAGPPARRPA